MMLKGFLSYAAFNNDHDSGRIIEIGKFLANEIKAQSGEDFELFIDRDDIKWGQSWNERIANSINHCTFFFPIITPEFLNREYCVKEAMQAFELEKNNSDLRIIFPILYIDIKNPSQRKNDLLVALLKRQFLDLRNTRIEPVSEMIKQIIIGVEGLCQHIFERQCKSLVEPEQDRLLEAPEIIGFVSKKHDSLNYGKGAQASVYEVHEGENSISDILNKAESGAKICIFPGEYNESILLTKTVEIVGMGKGPEEVIIKGDIAPALTVKVDMSRISNLTFVQTKVSGLPSAIVSQGRGFIENCVFENGGENGIVICNATPVIRNSIIRDFSSFGVVYEEQAGGQIEDCEIYRNGLANIVITSLSNPFIRRNNIHSGRQSGIYVCQNGRGIIEHNFIYDNYHAGVATSYGGNPVVKNNKVTRSRLYGGIYVFKRGLGTFEYNNLKGNHKLAIQVTEKCRPNIKLLRNQT